MIRLFPAAGFAAAVQHLCSPAVNAISLSALQANRLHWGGSSRDCRRGGFGGLLLCAVGHNAWVARPANACTPYPSTQALCASYNFRVRTDFSSRITDTKLACCSGNLPPQNVDCATGEKINKRTGDRRRGEGVLLWAWAYVYVCTWNIVVHFQT